MPGAASCAGKGSAGADLCNYARHSPVTVAVAADRAVEVLVVAIIAGAYQRGGRQGHERGDPLWEGGHAVVQLTAAVAACEGSRRVSVRAAALSTPVQRLVSWRGRHRAARARHPQLAGAMRKPAVAARAAASCAVEVAEPGLVHGAHVARHIGWWAVCGVLLHCRHQGSHESIQADRHRQAFPFLLAPRCCRLLWRRDKQIALACKQAHSYGMIRALSRSQAAAVGRWRPCRPPHAACCGAGAGMAAAATLQVLTCLVAALARHLFPGCAAGEAKLVAAAAGDVAAALAKLNHVLALRHSSARRMKKHASLLLPDPELRGNAAGNQVWYACIFACARTCIRSCTRAHACIRRQAKQAAGTCVKKCIMLESTPGRSAATADAPPLAAALGLPVGDQWRAVPAGIGAQSDGVHASSIFILV